MTSAFLKKLLRFLQLFLLLIVLLELGYYFILLPYTSLATIEVNTVLSLTEEQVLRMSALQLPISYFEVQPKELEKNMEKFFRIRKAHVRKKFPRTLIIDLEERKPLAIVLGAVISGKVLPGLLDEEGVIFEVGSTMSAWDLPVISGMRLSVLSLGSQVSTEMLPFLADLYQCRLQYPDVYAQISEYSILKTMRHYEVLMYPRQQLLPVRLSLPLNYYHFKQALPVLRTVLSYNNPSSFDELDYRGELAVLKGEYNG